MIDRWRPPHRCSPPLPLTHARHGSRGPSAASLGHGGRGQSAGAHGQGRHGQGVHESKVGAASGGGVDANGGWRSNDVALGGDGKQNKTYDDDVSPSDQVQSKPHANTDGQEGYFSLPNT